VCVYISGKMYSYVRIYCDANIYLDFLLDRKSPTGEPLGMYAQWIFSYARHCHFYIIISGHVIKEVKRNIHPSRHVYFHKLLEKLEPKLIRVDVTDDDRLRARQIDSFDNFSDALHVVLAVNHGADAIITNNYVDFVQYLPYLGDVRLIKPINIATLLPNP